MFRTILLFLTLVLLGCKETNSKSLPTNSNSQQDSAESVRWNRPSCAASEDPLSCLRSQCANVGGEIDPLQLICRCKNRNASFITSETGACIQGKEKEHDSVGYEWGNQNSMVINLTYLKDLNPKSRELIRDDLSGISLGARGVYIFEKANSTYFKEFLKVMLESPYSFSQIFNFYRPEATLDDNSINAGINNQFVTSISRFFFLPQEKIPEVDNLVLKSAAGAILQNLTTPLNGGVFSFASEMGCAELCTVKYSVAESNLAKVTRERFYFRGGILDDHFTVTDRNTSESIATIYLLNNKISHLLYRKANGERWLLDSLGKEVVKIFDAPLLARPNPRPYEKNAVPVMVFEGGDSYPELDKAALYGPYLDSHYYGWFKQDDGKPFLLGQRFVRVGEEDMGGGSHQRRVIGLASNGYKDPIIPFSAMHLWNGDFRDFLRNYSEKFVANISFTNVLTPKICSKSEIADIIRATKERSLWVVGAGNSGSEMKKESSWNCPQSLNDQNILMVASSGDGKSIHRSSSYGVGYADLVALGCELGKESCEVSATSYAAPRVAQSAARLMEEFPRFSSVKIRTALLLTARVPFKDNAWNLKNNFFPVKSGGFLDAEAASVFLTSDEHAPLEDRLLQAKANQYPGVRKTNVKALIKAQIDRWLEIGGVL